MNEMNWDAFSLALLGISRKLVNFRHNWGQVSILFFLRFSLVRTCEWKLKKITELGSVSFLLERTIVPRKIRYRWENRRKTTATSIDTTDGAPILVVDIQLGSRGTHKICVRHGDDIHRMAKIPDFRYFCENNKIWKIRFVKKRNFHEESLVWFLFGAPFEQTGWENPCRSITTYFCLRCPCSIRCNLRPTKRNTSVRLFPLWNSGDETSVVLGLCLCVCFQK